MDFVSWGSVLEIDKKYSIIYADPPWNYRDRRKGYGGVGDHYLTMKIDDIKRLPVRDIASDNCFLFLWATFPNLDKALDVIDSWGFCVEKSTKILRADLTWAKAGELKTGDRLLSDRKSVV